MRLAHTYPTMLPVDHLGVIFLVGVAGSGKIFLTLTRWMARKRVVRFKPVYLAVEQLPGARASVSSAALGKMVVRVQTCVLNARRALGSAAKFS